MSASAREKGGGEECFCEECGHPGAVAIAGRQLCAECCQRRGSCCAEFGGDDLTVASASAAPDAKPQ